MKFVFCLFGCGFLFVFTYVYALRIVCTDKILRFENTLIIIITVTDHHRQGTVFFLSFFVFCLFFVCLLFLLLLLLNFVW